MHSIKKTQEQRSPSSHSFNAARVIVDLAFRDLGHSDDDIRLESAQFLMGKTLKPFTDILKVSESEIQALAKMALKEDVGARRRAAAKEASRKFTALCERSRSTSSTKL
jgi:hypothetical protein